MQGILSFIENRTTQNTQIVLKYDYKDKIINDVLDDEQTIRVMFKYYY